MKLKINLAFCMAAMLLFVAVIIMTQTVQIAATSSCKELNQPNCYQGQNQGVFCSSKDQTKAVTRWYNEKGICKKFSYKGCNGNRNRFCTKEACQRRCAGDD